MLSILMFFMVAILALALFGGVVLAIAKFFYSIIKDIVGGIIDLFRKK